MSLDQTPPKSFEDRLDAYSDSTKNAVKKSKSITNATGYLAGTAAALAMGSSEAEAAIHVHQVNLLFDGASNPGGLGFDVDGYGPDHFGFDFLFQGISDGAGPGTDFFRFGLGTTQLIEVAGRNYVSTGGASFSSYKMPYLMGLGDDVAALPFLPAGAGSVADKFLAWGGSGTYPPIGDWVGGNSGYIGFRIDGDGVPGGDTYLGWIEVSVDASNGSGEVIRYAIEDVPNATELIITGIPEPSSLSCLALGAAGLLGWRQRRKNVA